MMSFSESVRTCMRKFFVTSGRASRSEFWWFQLFWYLVVFSPISICFISPDLEEIGFGLIGIFLVIFIAPIFCVRIRRYHDVGYSGFVILVNFIPYIGSIFLFILELLPSKPDNKYGPKPFSGKEKQSDKKVNGEDTKKENVKEIIDVEI